MLPWWEGPSGCDKRVKWKHFILFCFHTSGAVRSSVKKMLAILHALFYLAHRKLQYTVFALNGFVVCNDRPAVDRQALVTAVIVLGQHPLPRPVGY